MKYAVVTGGTKGIGLGIVKVLLERGFHVFTNYARDKNKAKREELIHYVMGAVDGKVSPRIVDKLLELNNSIKA